MTKKSNSPSRVGREDNFIPRRLNVLFSIVILLLSVLLARLAYMQIMNREFYTKKLATASQKTIQKALFVVKSMMPKARPWSKTR